MRYWRSAAAAAALALGLAEAAAAQELDEATAPQTQSAGRQMSRWGALFPSVVVASEYRFDGKSNSSGEPVVQASLYWWRPDKTFVGVWASTVDFSGYYDPNTSYEIDVYAGRNWDFGGPDWYAGADTRLTLQVMYSMFPDNETPGPTYDFLQLKTRVQHRLDDRWTLDSSVSFVPQASYGAGRSWKWDVGASYRVNSWLSVGGSAGVQDVQRRNDYAYWNFGATATIGQAEFDLRYYDTDLNYIDCGYSANCGSALVGKLMWNFY